MRQWWVSYSTDYFPGEVFYAVSDTHPFLWYADINRDRYGPKYGLLGWHELTEEDVQIGKQTGMIE